MAKNGTTNGKTGHEAAASLAARAEWFSTGLIAGLGTRGGWSAAIAGVLLAAGPALAGPDGAKVVRGNVSISRNGNETLIRAGRNSIINYRSFNIGQNESVRFVQPDAQARVLNRIQSAAPTRIDGSLIANGRVYIVNPAGVVFGNNAVVNVGRLYAAAGNISDTDFVRGIDRFTNMNGEVSNYGNLTADFVTLAGKRAANEGTINAPQGTVVMAAGNDVMVGERTGNVFVKVGGGNPGKDGGVSNKGVVNARGGKALMAAGDMFALALGAGSEVTAKDVTIEGQGRGEVIVSGSIDASNQGRDGSGGTVKVLGEKVGLSGATIDASGTTGGGEVLVGGNYQGQGSERNASRTYVSPNTTIKANATETGNGGQVVVWANEVTRFGGTIESKGGAQAGDGGNVEVSGKQDLLFAGKVDTTAPNGKTGNLLLDPDVITISGATAADDAQLSDDTVNFADGGAVTFTIGTNTINDTAASTNITLQANQTINFNSAISMSNNGAGIIARSGGDINVNASITTRGGSLNFTANDSGGTQSGSGSININAAITTDGNNQPGGLVTLTVQGGTGSILLNNSIQTRNAAVTFAGPVVVQGNRSIDTVDGQSGANVSFNSTVRGNAAGADDLTITAGSGTVGFTGAVGSGTSIHNLDVTGTAVNVLGGITTGSGGTVSITNSSQLTVSGADWSLDGAFTQSGGGAVSLGSSITTTNDDISFANATTISANGLFYLAGTGTISFGSTVAAGANTYLLEANEIDLGGNLTGTGDLTLRGPAGRDIRIDTGTSAAFLDLTPTEIGRIQSGFNSVTIGRNDGTGGVINVNNTPTFASNTILHSGGAMTIGASITANGNLTLRSANALTINQDITLGTVGRTLTIDGQGGAGQDVGFGANVDLAASNIVFQTGSGGATIDAVTNTVRLRGNGGGATNPTSFTRLASGALSNSTNDTPAVAQFGAGNVTGLSYTLQTSGALTFDDAAKVAGSNLTLTGTTVDYSVSAAAQSYTFNGTTTLNADVVSAAGGTGNITFNGPVVLPANRIVNSSAANGTIAFGASATVNGSAAGAQSLTLNAGTGAITVGAAMGGSTALGAISFTGATRLDANLTTEGGLITFNNGVTLNAATVAIDTTNAGASAGAGVTFSQTLNAFAATTSGISLRTGTGAIQFTGVVGGVNRPTDVTIVSAGNVTASAAFTAGTFTQQAGTGTTTFSGLLSANSAGGGNISITTDTVDLAGGVATAGDGDLTVSVATLLTIGTNISLDGSFTKNGAGDVNLNANITVFSEAGEPENITFNNGNIILGAPNITLAVDTGGSATLGGTIFLNCSVDLQDRNFILAANEIDLTAGGSISDTASGTGTVTLRGASAATTIDVGIVGGAGTLDLSPTDLQAFADNIMSQLIIGDAAQSGLVRVQFPQFGNPTLLRAPSGTIQLDDGTTMAATNSAAPLTLTAQTISLGGTIRTDRAAITLNGAVVLRDGQSVALDTTNGGSGAAGANITVNGTVSGTASGVSEQLFIAAGTGGAISVTGNVGTSGLRLGLFQVSNGLSLSTQGVAADQIGTSTVTTQSFGGLLDATDFITISGTAITLTGGATTTDAGGQGDMTVGHSGLLNILAAVTLQGSFTSNGNGNTDIGANISTATSSANRDITFNNGGIARVNAASVTVNAGAGTIAFNNVNAGDSLNVNGNALTLQADEIDFAGGANTVFGNGSGTLTLLGGTTATTIGVGGGAGTLDLSTTDLAALRDEVAANIVVGSSSGNADVTVGASTFRDAVTFRTGNTSTVFTTGTITGANADSGVSIIAPNVSLGGNIVTAATGAPGAILINGVTVLSANTLLDTTNGGATAGGAITFQGSTSTVNATSAGGQSLSLRAGTGDVTLGGNAGTNFAFSTFTITSAANATASAVSAGTITSTVTTNASFGALTAGAGGITSSAGAGTYSGLMTAGAGGITLNGTAHTVNAGATTTAGGTFTANNTGLLTLANTALSLDGAFDRTAGTTNLGVNISTTNDAITFTGNTTVTATGRTLASGSAAITFNNALALGTNGLTLSANDYVFAGGADSITGGSGSQICLVSADDTTSIGVVGGTGTLQITQPELDAIASSVSEIQIGSPTGTYTITANAATYKTAVTFRSATAINGTQTVLGSGGQCLTFNAATNVGADLTAPCIVFNSTGALTGTAIFTATDAAGPITFASTFNVGVGNLTLISNAINLNGGNNSVSGTGSIAFAPLSSSASIGVGGGAGSLQLTSGLFDALANGFTNIFVGNAAGTHVITLGAATYKDPITFRAPNAGGQIVITGTQTGTGDASITFNSPDNRLSAAVTTANQLIRFQGNTTVLPGSASINSGTGLTQFDAGLNMNGQSLTIRANAIDFLGGASSVTGTGVGTLTILGATDATTIGLGGGSGTLQLDDTDLLAFSDEAVGQFVFGSSSYTGDITLDSVTFRDAVRVENIAAGVLNVVSTTVGQPGIRGAQSDATVTLVGADVRLGAGITTPGALISITGPVMVSGSVALDTTNAGAVTAGANVTVNNTIDGTSALADDLLFNVGDGTLTLGGNLGGTTRLGDVTIQTAGIVNAQGIRAASLTQSAANATTGATTFAGAVDTTTLVDLTGRDFTFQNTVTAGSTIDVDGRDGTFSGAVSAGGNVTVTGSAFTFSAGLTTTSGGGFTADHTGDLTIQTGIFNLDGAFTDNGVGNTLLGGNITTTGDAVSLGGATTILTTDVVITTAGGNVSLSNALDGVSAASQSLTIAAGSGAVNFSGNVGDIATLSDFTVSNSGSSVLAGVSVSNAIDVNASGNIQFTGNLSGSSINAHGGTSGVGNVLIDAITASAGTQSYRAGNGSGNVAFVSIDPNAAFSGVTTFTLRQDAAIPDVGIPTAGQFLSGVSGISYTLQSDGGTITLDTASKVAGSNLTLIGTGVTINPAVTLASLSVTGPLTVGSGGAITTTAGDLVITNGLAGLSTGTFFTAQSGKVVLGGGTAGANDLTITGDEIDITAALSGTGQLVLQSFTTSRDIELGAGGSDLNVNKLDLGAAELAFLQDGFSSIFIGRSDATGGIALAGPVSFADPVTLRTPGGTTNIAFDLTGTDNASITLIAMSHLLGANITTSGGLVSIQGDSTLTSDVTVDTTNGGAAPAGGNVTFTAAVEADDQSNNRNLTINAGTSTIDLQGAVGSSQALATLTATGGDPGIPSIFLESVTTTGQQTYNGFVSAAGDLTSTTAGAIRILGSVLLENSISISTAGGAATDDITITGTVDSDTFGTHALTLNAGAGDIAISQSVGSSGLLDTLTATGASISLRNVATNGNQTYTGLVALNGALAAQGGGSAITITGPLSLEGDSSLQAGAAVSVNGNIASALNQGRSLTILSTPTITITGNVGQDAGTELGSLITTGSGTLAFGDSSANQQVIRTVGAQNYAHGVTVTQNTLFSSNSGGAITFGSSVNSGATARAMQVTTSGTTGFVGTIGGLAALQSLTVDGGGTTNFGSNVTTIGDTTISDSSVLTGNLTFNGATVTFGGTVNGDGAGSRDSLTVNASTAANLDGAVGGTDALSAVALTAPSIRLVSVTTNGVQSYTGTATLNGTLDSTGAGAITFTGNLLVSGTSTIRTAGNAVSDDINITGTINSTNGTNGLTLLVQGSRLGDVTLGGAVGGSSPLADLTITAATLALRDVTTVGNQLYTAATGLTGNLTTTGAGTIAMGGPLTLQQDVVITTANGGVTLLAVDSDSTSRALTINTGGSGVTDLGAIGSTARLRSLTTNSDGSTLLRGGVVATAQDQFYGDAVVLAADTTLTANDVTFSGALNGDTASTRSLVVNTESTGVTAFGGVVGGTAKLRSLTTNSDGSTRVGANITTDQGMDFGDTLTLSGDSVMDAGTGGIFFRKTIDTDASATDRSLSLRSTQVADQDTVPFRFGGNIGAARRLGGLSIGADASSPVLGTTALITDAFDANGKVLASGVAANDALTITVGSGGFDMGRGQKLTALGNLNITSAGAARLGDLTALGDIRVTSSQIQLRLREPGQVISNERDNGNFVRRNDLGLDFVTGGDFFFSSRPTPIGTGSQAVFANPTGNTLSASLLGFQFVQSEPAVSQALFADPRTAGQLLGLDLPARGPSGTGIATSIAGAIPRDTETREVTTPVTVGKALREPLNEMGIATRDLDPNELIEFLVGRSLYRDLPLQANPQPGRDYTVTVNRLSQPTVVAAVEAYRKLVEVVAVDPKTGEPLLKPDGTPQVVNRSDVVRDTIGSAYEAYAGTTDQPDGVGFRAWLEGRGSQATKQEAEALEFLNLTRDLLDRLDELGLSPFEASIPKKRLLGTITPPQMDSAEEFEAAVYGRKVALLE